MSINQKYFLPRVDEFCKQAENIGEEGFPDSGLFIPYTFKHYDTAPKKIFYVGRDSAGWIGFQEMMSDFKNGVLCDYLEKNSNVVTVQEKRGKDKHNLKEDWKSNKAEFLPFCQKLHIYITTGRFIEDIHSLKDEDYQLIEQMGYGNLNSLEHDETLKKLPKDNPIWYRIDRKKFYQLRQASRQLDRLIHIIEAYHPDLIIILNGEDREDVFNGLQIKDVMHRNITQKVKRDIYTIEGYSTQVLWSIHPVSFKFHSITQEMMIKSLGDTARELLSL